jgi:non-specific serine/threonine protein kinase/serine/threonine-protein kinase
MDGQRWAKVKDIFGVAIERPPEARAAFLDASCAGDAALRVEVDALLAAHAAAGEEFLEAGSEQRPALPDFSGRRIGPYRVEAELGRGGMGVVYRASRDDFDKAVALKVVARGGEEVHARLERERRILARLQHPNIAAILDGGRTPEGAPYLVMELVEGQPIDAYCRARRLTTRERLALFRTVCGAVAYAHQNLIVHRDLKPDNILVTAAGAPKLLDFGIAKLLAESGGDPARAPTATLLPALTPAYASPEQVMNQPVTTASDVYSLGVLLYELLTGRSPLGDASPAWPDMVRAVCETLPDAPSAAARAARGASPATAGELAGDLDVIVMTALRKEPERRYGSVTELGEDVRRHLEGRPVRARGDGAGYRLAKFARRHRLELTAAAGVLVALVAGVMATARQARIAERERAVATRRFDESRELARSFIVDVDREISHLAGANPARRVIVDKGLTFLNRLAADADAADDPRLLVDLAAGYVRVGDILGSPDHPSLGDPAGARAAYERSLSLARSVVARDRASPDARLRVWAALSRLGVLAGSQSSVSEGLALLREALAFVDESIALHPDDIELPRDRLVTLGVIARLQMKAGDDAGALASFHAVRDAALAFRAAHPEHPEADRDLFISHLELANHARESGQHADAAASARAGLAMAEAAARAQPDNAQARRDVATALMYLAEALVGAGRAAEAIAPAERCLALNEALAAADRADALAQLDVVKSTLLVGTTLVAAGRPREGLARHERALALAEAGIAALPDSRPLRAQLAQAQLLVGRSHAALGDAAAAATALARAIAVQEELCRADPSDAVARATLDEMKGALAGVGGRGP